MIDPNPTPVQESNRSGELRQQLFSAPEKQQLQLMDKLASLDDVRSTILMEFLQAHQNREPTPALGKAYQILCQRPTAQSEDFLKAHFPEGLVPLNSQQNVDYRSLQTALLEQNFQLADRLTLEKLCELAGEAALKRNWFYFSEVNKFPIADLRTIDTLWRVYSEGKFGFSVQREIWLSQGKDFSKVWAKIGWRADNNWTRYPHEFTWNLSAPRGHLPLSNQLRGVRAIASLLSHPAWSEKEV